MESYFQSAVPEPYRILGLKLRPFSLGHYILLSRFEVAFVSEVEAVATVEDLIFGVLCCHHTYETFLDFLNSETLFAEVEKLGAANAGFNVEEKIALFQRYIKEGSAMPKYWEEKTGKPSGGHWAQAVKLCLTSKLGYTETEALNAPLTQAFADYFKHAEAEGMIRLMTAEEIAFIESPQPEPQPEAATC